VVVLLDRVDPRQPLHEERDDGLRPIYVGLLCGHQVGLVPSLPLDEVFQLAVLVGGANDPFGNEPAMGDPHWSVTFRLAHHLKGLDEVRTVEEVFFGLPGAILVAVVSPLEEVPYLALFVEMPVDNLLDMKDFFLRGAGINSRAFLGRIHLHLRHRWHGGVKSGRVRE
jgi:hypothetical protein